MRKASRELKRSRSRKKMRREECQGSQGEGDGGIQAVGVAKDRPQGKPELQDSQEPGNCTVQDGMAGVEENR